MSIRSEVLSVFTNPPTRTIERLMAHETVRRVARSWVMAGMAAVLGSQTMHQCLGGG